MPTIHLAKYASRGSRVFVGRMRGTACRRAADLDAFDHGDEVVTVVVPDDTLAIATSFFMGMFCESIAALGSVEFRRRYVFVGKISQQGRRCCCSGLSARRRWSIGVIALPTPYARLATLSARIEVRIPSVK